MQIDWFTVGAQIVNFLVLVWLLKHFLYGPITQAMERREQRVKDRLREAELTKQEAENEARAFEEKQEDLKRQSERMLNEARASAEEERKVLERQAREEVDTRRREWLHQLETERASFLSQLRDRSTEQFYALAARALDDLGNADLEDQMAFGFIKRLESLQGKAKEDLAHECAAAGGKLTVHSRFALSSEARRRVTAAIHRELGKTLQPEYETRGQGTSGIELKAGSLTVSWGFESYLDGLQRAIEEQFSALSTVDESKADE